ncbi:MAG: endonuclease [Bacteroidaceae bacterium]|nr:endonuclease [Bacteroidaceae bacterium]
MKTIASALMALAITMNMCAEEMPEGYYDAIDGKKDKDLKSAISAVIRSHTAIPYGSGKGNTWEVFYYSDRDPKTGLCMDMYCDNWSVLSNPGQVASGCNIEHSFAKSWWGGAKNDAYKDCYHLNPSNSTANSARSNYPLGVPTKSIKSGTGSIKVGLATYNGMTFWVFEPKDEYKGDFARAYFYMATCYGDELSWRKDNKDVGSYYAMRPASDANEYLEFLDWEIDVLLKWHREDPVSEKELRRMDAVSDYQHNRNPYIDYPELVEYIWGDKKGHSLNLATLDRTTGIDDVFVDAKPESAKFLVNGRLVIRKDGILYDLSGRRK